MKTFDPDYKLLDEMYQDDYYPVFLVDKVKDELQKVIDLLESGETDTEVVQEKLDEAVCGINDLQDEFYENNSEIETVARDCIGVTVDYILKWFGIPIDMEEAMQTLATRYHLTFKELYAFSRWGQSCTTGLFEKGGREFVFVPGDTVILGWESFVQGMDKANQEELADIFAEIEYEGSAEEFLRQGMTPVRQVTIAPMFVGRKLEEIGWESVLMNDPRITAHPDWLENLQKWAGQNSQSFEIHETVRFERNGDSWRAWLCHPMTYPEFQRSLLWELAASLPTPDEWAYLCGGGCRTLFPWGDGLDHKMKLHHFENGEDQGKPYDMEQPNFFGLSIAYDPYKRELVDGKTLTTCGGDGGCNVCGGMGPLLGYLPCSPHCKPEVREDNEIHNDYDFFRPVIRVQTSGWRIVSPENER